jgi:RNase H-like domain found in reverse transcriptase
MVNWRKEALAILWGMEKFAPFLLGSKFTVYTDHRSLQWLLNHETGRLARWGLRASEFDFDISYLPGKKKRCARPRI